MLVLHGKQYSSVVSSALKKYFLKSAKSYIYGAWYNTIFHEFWQSWKFESHPVVSLDNFIPVRYGHTDMQILGT